MHLHVKETHSNKLRLLGSSVYRILSSRYFLFAFPELEKLCKHLQHFGSELQRKHVIFCHLH